MKISSKVYCVTGIDTDIGKTIVTGVLARGFCNNNISTVTQKFVQTGCSGVSEDIVAHRRFMDSDLLGVDLNGTTCPFVFTTPCSPHLAAQLENSTIDCDTIRRATCTLLEQYEVVLLEGAGGLAVPITKEFTFLDYLQDEGYPLIVVTSPRLGSINHTLSTLELAYTRNIPVAGVVYNCFGENDSRIVEDSRDVFKYYLEKFGFTCRIVDMPSITDGVDNAIGDELFKGLFG